jgi:hypothetical protein
MSLATQLASSVRTVLAMITAPAARSRVVSVASYGGISPANARAPPVVAMSVVWMLSLRAIGMPCSGPRTARDAVLVVAADASSSRPRVHGDRGVEAGLVARDPVEDCWHDGARRGAASLHGRAQSAIVASPP